MKIIPITRTPNQSISIVISEVLYEIRLTSRDGSVCADIDADGELIVLGARVVANEAIIQPPSLLPDKCFCLVTSDNDIVDYNQFGLTQILCYFTPADFADALNVTIPQTPITV